jgi:hypothetical protein
VLLWVVIACGWLLVAALGFVAFQLWLDDRRIEADYDGD